MNRPHCDPQRVFELAEGELPAQTERELRGHMDACPACRALYREELELSARIASLDVGETRSVCRNVAMDLPTRLTAVRIAWASLAVVLLAIATISLSLDGTNPAALVIDVLGAFWGFVSGLTDVAESLLVVAGPALLLALGIGALVDLAIAGVVFSVFRRRAREA